MIDIPPRIILKGDKTRARDFIGAGKSQLRILERSMEFQELNTGIRRTVLDDGVYAKAIITNNLKEVIIYCEPQVVELAEEEEEKEFITVFIKVLVQNGRGEAGDAEGAFFKDTAYWIYLEIDETEEVPTCTLHLIETTRPVPDHLISYCSQCKYKYEPTSSESPSESPSESSSISPSASESPSESPSGSSSCQPPTELQPNVEREASLLHYQSSLIGETGKDIVLTVVGHGNNSADFHYRTEGLYDGFVVNAFGALSYDLTVFYFSLYKLNFAGGQQHKAVSLRYSIYDLDAVAADPATNSWDVRCSGTTSTANDLVDIVLTRDGKMGCWRTTTSIGYTTSPAETHLEDCFRVNYGDSTCTYDSGHSTYRYGIKADRVFETFDLATEEFIETAPMEAFHMSYLCKDYVNCIAKNDVEYPHGTHYYETDCYCTCVPCPGRYSCYASSITMEFEKYNWGSGEGDGYSRDILLYNGLELENASIDEDEDLELHYNPDWGQFWSGARYYATKSYDASAGCYTGSPPACGYASAWGEQEEESHTGSVIVSDRDTDVTIVQKVTDTTGVHNYYDGDCGLDGTSPVGYIRQACISGRIQYVCYFEFWGLWGPFCNDNTFEESGEVDTFARRNYNPIDFEMNMSGDHVLDIIHGSFISYDQASGCMVRGMRVCENCWPDAVTEGDWEILLDHPLLGEWDIAEELESLLADKECSIIETILFVPEEQLPKSVL